jgi:hypothetical protein
MGKKEVLEEEFIITSDFCGPKIKRGCTDILCLLLLLCSWAAMTCMLLIYFNIRITTVKVLALQH